MNEQVPIPKEQLRIQRQQILQKVSRERRLKKQLLTSTFVLIAAMAVLTFSIRVSPTIAGYVGKIPGFAPIVEMIAYDKGMQDIVDNEYYEDIGVAVTKNNITLAVVGVVADYTGMNIFTEISAPFPISNMDYKEVKIFNNGKELEAGISYIWNSNVETSNIEGYFQVVVESGLIYDSRNFSLEVIFEDEQQTTIQVPFTLKNEIAETVMLAQNVPVEVAEQKFTVTKLEMSPLRATLEVELDEQNTMQILSFDDLRLIDENGEEWASILNGISANGSMRDDHLKLYMQSNYFRIPQKLRLVIGEVAALPKDDDFLIVDFETQQILSKPKVFDWDIQLSGKTFSITGENDRHFGRPILGQLIDANGNSFNADVSSMSVDDTKIYNEESFSDLIVSPAKVYIDYYPHIIGSDIEVNIK